MARLHFYRPLLDNQGNLVTDATVRVLKPGTSTLIEDTLWNASTGGAPLNNPFTPTSGIVDFYLDTAQNIRLGVLRSGQAEVFVEDLSVGDLNMETFAFSLAGAMTVQAGNLRFYIEDPCVVEKVRVSVGMPPAGADLVVDVNKNGTTMFTNQANRPTVVAGANTGTAVPDDPTLNPDDYLTIDVDQIGSSTAGSDLVVQVRTRRL